MSLRLSALALCACTLLGPQPALAGDPWALPRQVVTHFRLENGLEVVLEPMPGHPVVAALVAYEAGRSHDPPGHAGLAHLVEHLTYRGSRHLRGQGIFEQLDAAGARRWNGTTSDDLATYHAVVPAERFLLPLWIESERMAFTLEMFDEQSLELERLRVTKELLQRGALTPNFTQFLNHALYPEGHPYHRSSDEVDDVRAAELKDVAWFFQRHYRPDNAYLVMVGGFPARAAEEVRRYFAPIVNPPGAAPRLTPRPRAFPARETLVVEQPVYEDNVLAMVFPAPGLGSDDAAAFDVLAALLGGGGRWSLEHALLGNAFLAESVAVQVRRAKLDNLLMIRVQLRHGVAMERAEYAVERHLAELAGFDDANAVRDIRTALAVAALKRLADPLERARLHLEHLRARGEPFDIAVEIANQRRVSPQRLAAVATKFLDPKRRLAARLVEGGPACCYGCVKHEVGTP